MRLAPNNRLEKHLTLRLNILGTIIFIQSYDKLPAV